MLLLKNTYIVNLEKKMNMFGKGSRLYSIFKMRCPRCQEGDFMVSHHYDLSQVGEIHEHCNVCGLKYSNEPGFYYGAMYVAYASAFLEVGLFRDRAGGIQRQLVD